MQAHLTPHQLLAFFHSRAQLDQAVLALAAGGGAATGRGGQAGAAVDLVRANATHLQPRGPW